jgi:hypothetical protein
MCRPQDISAEMTTSAFGVFNHVKVEEIPNALAETHAHYHEEETSDSEMSDSEKHTSAEHDHDGAPKTKKRKIWRVMLSPHQALEIYNRRPPLKQVNN